MAKQSDCAPEGPNESIFKPPANKMPVKDYPANQRIGPHGGHSGTIEGPGTQKGDK